MKQSDIYLIIGFISLVVIVSREIWCWYLKINKISKLLEKIEENTRKESKKATVPDPKF